MLHIIFVCDLIPVSGSDFVTLEWELTVFAVLWQPGIVAYRDQLFFASYCDNSANETDMYIVMNNRTILAYVKSTSNHPS
jgi:hypothetical protein